jgi:hypothetical protein
MACSFLFLAFLTTAAAACLSAAAATGKLVPPPETPSLSFGEGYTQLFGDSNLALHGGGKRVHISLDERTGGSRLGFAVLFSPECPIDGNGKPCFVLFLLCSLTSSLLCSALLRYAQAPGSRRRPRTSTGSSAPASSCPPITRPASSSPSTYVSNPPHSCTGLWLAHEPMRCFVFDEPGWVGDGVMRCDAMQMSNGDVYERTHDELDFEFLGNVRGREWRVQTNVYGNGSTAVGREERYGLWFDPTEDFHRYAIHWSRHRIM